MNNTFLQHLSQRGSLDSNLILRHYDLDLMARFMRKKSMNPKVRQDQIAKKLGCSSSGLQRCRQDINMLSPFRIQSKSIKRKQRT